MGYKRFSPDVNNPFNIIPSGRITMEDVDFPVTGIDDLGNESIMFPGEEYSFPGNMVLELPHKEHRNVEAHGGAFGDNNFIGYSGQLNSKNVDIHGTYIKPLQNIAARNGMLDIGLDLKYQRGDNEFSLRPHAHLGRDPQFGVSVGYKRSFQDGGEEPLVDEAAMNAMMKARLAYEEMHGNPAAKRMVAPVDNPYIFNNDEIGTHYMGSYDNYAIPNIQDVNGRLEMTGPRANEEMRFDRPEDAEYFAENYKRVSPAFQQNGGQIPKAQDGMQIVADQMLQEARDKKAKEDEIPEPTQAYLNDLYISDKDLELLNARPENIQYEDLTEADKNKKYHSYAHRKKISAKEFQDYYGGFDFNDLSSEGKREANPYYCDPTKGCLASAFDSYDELVGQRYRAQDFMNEAKLKKALDLQSLPRGYRARYDEQGNLTFTKNGKPVSQRTHDWIMSQGDYFKQGKSKIYVDYDKETKENIYAKNPDGSFKYGDKYDFTADSWDIHSIIKNKGGKNIFTKNPKDYTKGDYDEYYDRNNLGEYKGKTMADLSERELKKIYSQITPGTIIGFGDNHAGSNEKDGMAGSSHSAIVVGFDKRGVPIIYDYGNYVPLDGNTMYGFSGISNISVPKQMKGKNLEWAKDQGMYSGKDPKDLDLQINNIVEAGGDEDEVVPFYEALKENKNSLMNDLKIRPKHYDMFSKLLIGISMEETEGGSGTQHNIEQMIPGTPGQESVGLTQLMWSNIEGDDKLKRIAKKYNINDIGDLKDPKKSAIASMIYASRNMSSAKKNYRKGKGQKGLRTYYPANSVKQNIKSLIGKNPTFDGYTFRTEEGVDVDFVTGNSLIGWDKPIEKIQSQFDEIAPGKYTVREEDGEYVVDKVTEGNAELTPEQMFIYNWNSPNTLLKGDAQGGANYVNNVLGYYDQLQSGGEISSKDIEAKQQALQEELANLDAFQLQPAQLLKMQTQLYDTYNENVPRKFRIGGPKLSPELKLYKDYIVGKDESQEAQKNYDKLNRVYYREAKVNNMHPSNYIMTTMIS